MLQDWGKKVLKQPVCGVNSVMMIFQLILLFLGFFIISCTARGQALSEFCFANPKQASKGIKYANQILIKSEKFIYQPGQSCAQIYLEEESRFELIDLFIRRKFFLKRSSGSLTQAHRSKNASQHCRLVLEEIGHQNDNSNKISIGSKSLVKGYGTEITDRFQTTIVMMSGKSAVVMTPDGEIKVTCQITNSGAANVTFSMQSKNIFASLDHARANFICRVFFFTKSRSG